jgi:4-amino-4-deoxy-L-arabinose transferase-like glycosyltransferase
MVDSPQQDAQRRLISPRAESREPRAWLAVVLITSLVRTVIAALTPLFPDETYYWEWSRHLAAGYYDHPLMIAWLIRFGTTIAGHTPLGVRLGAVLAGALGTLFVCASARRMVDDRAALLTAIIFAVMPLSAAGLVLATPDAPVLAASAATIYAIVRVLEAPVRSRASLEWWCVAGAALGLAFCSKYTAVLLPLGIFVGLLFRRELRVRLREAGPYVATVVALLVFLPVILWNARHDWISFAFQLQHGFSDAAGSALKRELDLIGGQIGLVSPILFVMMLLAVASALRIRSRASILHPLLAALVVVVVAFFMYSATHRRVEPNWPALAYVPAVLLLVAHSRSPRWDKWLGAGVGLGAVLTTVAYVNAFTPILPVPAPRDPAARAAGWTDLAHAVEGARRACPMSHVRCPMSAVFIGADRYQEASELAFHLPERPETFSLNLSSRPNQYDLWPSFPDRAQPGDSLILVVDDVTGIHPAAEALASHFASMRQGGRIPLSRDGELVKNLRIWLLDGWRGTWPKRALRSRS